MADEVEIALGKRFLSRRDVKSVQAPDGSYCPERTPWKMTDLRQHVAGERSLGHFLVDQDGTTRLFAYDLDLKKTGYYLAMDEKILDPIEAQPRTDWLIPNHPGIEFWTIQLRCQAEALAMKAMDLGAAQHVAIAYSGNKGLHVYCFLDGPTLAAEARQVSQMILRSVNRYDGRMAYEPLRGENFWQSTSDRTPNIEIECFPKQDNLEGKDLGNLMRLPLGINRKSGNRSYFLDCRCGYNQLRVMEPLLALGSELPWD